MNPKIKEMELLIEVKNKTSYIAGKIDILCLINVDYAKFILSNTKIDLKISKYE
jgi:hypothetical protein